MKNYEGRGPGLLIVLDKATGNLKSSMELAAAVGFNGIAVTGQEVVVTLMNGSVMRLVP